ncbi:MAG: hypothetical protein GTO18_11885 [Anaerolineales bacterium]|nr:hypothetical protein [Anaerolineales bacterium]
MSTMNLYRWSGYAAILSGVLGIAAGLMEFSSMEETLILETTYIIQSALMLFGILGVFAVQHEEVGVIGFLGFILAVIGTALLVGGSWEIAGVPSYVWGGTLSGFGLLLLAIGTLSANVFPRWIPVVWILAVVVGLPSMMIPSLASITLLLASTLFAVGFIGAGVELIKGKFGITKESEAMV